MDHLLHNQHCSATARALIGRGRQIRLHDISIAQQSRSGAAEDAAVRHPELAGFTCQIRLASSNFWHCEGETSLAHA